MNSPNNRINIEQKPKKTYSKGNKNQYCPCCGSETDLDARFCHICGIELKKQLDNQEKKYKQSTELIIEENSPFSRYYTNFKFYLKGLENIKNSITLSTDYYLNSGFCLSIYNADFPLELNKLHLKKLNLINCKNFLISNASFKHIKIINCHNIRLREVLVEKKVEIESCSNIKLIKSKIHKLKILSGNNILVVNSNIHRLLRKKNIKIDFSGSQLDKEKIFND